MNPNQRQVLDLATRLESWAQRLAAVLRDALPELVRIRGELAQLSMPGPKLGPVKHIGEIVRWLREGARLARRELAKETGLAEATIKHVESGRHKSNAETIRKLLRAPCMSTLLELAESAGLALGLGRSGIGGPKAQPTEPATPTDLERLGQLVRRLREAGGLTRLELSTATGISVEVIRHLEVGKSEAPQIWKTLLAHPSMRELPEMANQQGITLDFLNTADNGGH